MYARPSLNHMANEVLSKSFRINETVTSGAPSKK